MGEYQYYKFERLGGYLDAKVRQALRAISSRAERRVLNLHFTLLRAEKCNGVLVEYKAVSQ